MPVTTCDAECSGYSCPVPSLGLFCGSASGVPSRATRRVVLRATGNSWRPPRRGIMPCLSAFVRTPTVLLTRLFTRRAKVGIFNLGSREPGHPGRTIESKRAAGIKHRGPGAGRCVLGHLHQPRCVSAIRLRPLFVLVPNARGEPGSGFEGPTRVENEANVRALVHPQARHPLPHQPSHAIAPSTFTKDTDMRRFAPS